jgi:hypothetical protein
MKRQSPKSPARPVLAIGLAWFNREQWLHLSEVVAERSELDDTFEQWERNAMAALYALESQGHSVRKVMIDVDLFVSWCRGRGRRIDSAARADYVSSLLRTADDLC